MAIYNNIFDPDQDHMLWELHEIRHELHQTLIQQTIEEFNAEAFKKYQQWQKELTSSHSEEQPIVVEHEVTRRTMACSRPLDHLAQ